MNSKLLIRLHVMIGELVGGQKAKACYREPYEGIQHDGVHKGLHFIKFSKVYQRSDTICIYPIKNSLLSGDELAIFFICGLVRSS